MSPSNSSCSRCHQPLAVESASGLCVSCLKSLETLEPAGTPRSSLNDANTSASRFEYDTVTRTATPDKAVHTETWDGQTRLRPAPPGYDLFRFLGGGGMGDVYLAREHVAERTVAMKFLRGAPNSTAADRFVTEIRALARLDHPNIVRFLTVQIDGADPHYTMEYGSGGTLLDRVKQEGPLPPTESARIALSLARALAAAHSANILHRDMKPSNVVLGADDTPKITDFGLAKLTDSDEGLTLGSGPLGTPAYMPPEQVSGKHGTVGPASDVYGLGATLYHLLTGQPPFQGQNEEIIPKVEREMPARVRSLRPEVSLGLEAIVHKCLEKRPADRYSTAEELASDLDRFLAGEAPAAPHLTPGRRATQWAKRNRRWFIASSAGLGLAVGLFVAGVLFAPKPQEEPPPPDPREEAKKELQAGRPVVLIPEAGPPKWYQTYFLPAQIRPPDQGDGACVFQSFDLSLIELLPDPGITRYRIRADVKRVTGEGPKGKAAVGLESIGVFFGADYQRTPNGRDAVTLCNLYFNDYKPLDPAIDALLRYNTGLVIDVGAKAERGPGTFWNAGGVDVKFTPAVDRPGPWRRVFIDVTDDKVSASWSESPEAAPKVLAEWSGNELQSRYGQSQTWLDELSPGLKLRPWAPQRSLGLWCFRSTLAVKNFVIEPLP